MVVVIWHPGTGLAGTQDSMAQIRDILGNSGWVATLWRGHTKSVRRHTATDLNCTIAGREGNAGTTAHAGTSVFYWDGSYETFAQLRCKLDNINISGLEFGV